MKPIPRLALSLALSLGAAVCHADRPLDAARSLVEEWVQVEQAISQETIAWKVKKAALEDLTKVAQTELALLQSELEKIESSATQADEERERLVADRSSVEQRMARIRNFLTEIEPRLVSLNDRLPPPLQRSLEPLLARIPENPRSTNIGAGERMQAVVSVLTAILAFDAKVTVDEDVRPLGNGAVGEVTTLWVGLGAAYYVDESRGEAGYGVPTAGGWEWRAQNDLRDDIKEAIALAQGRRQEARFIPLPVALANQ